MAGTRLWDLVASLLTPPCRVMGRSGGAWGKRSALLCLEHTSQCLGTDWTGGVQ